MKKLLFIFVISIIYVACTGNQPATTNASDSTSTAVAGPVVTMPYTPDYSSSFIAGKQADALTVLNSYKAWETGDMAAMANTYADSVSFNFPDGSSFIGTRDSAVAMAKKYREDLSSLKIDMDGWMPVHSSDKNQDWVLVWYKETDTHKGGQIDSSYYHDLNLMKDGKITFVQSQMRKYKK